MLMQRIVTEDGIPPGRVPEVRRYLGQVVHETSRAGRIVSDLLVFSRRSKPQKTLVDVNGVVQRTLSLVGHKLKLMNVTEETELAGDLPMVQCDGSQVQQVVLNLVMNGAESTRGKGSGRVRIRTARGPQPETVVIEVEDTGDGMTREQISKIFEPFYTTKDEGKGVGLGLAVVWGIVEAHGGRIGVQSVPGEGTTFRVTLPVLQDARGAEDGEGEVIGTA